MWLLEFFSRAQIGYKRAENVSMMSKILLYVWKTTYRKCPVRMTAQAPVFSPFVTWYTWSKPSRLFASLSCSARSSSPTAPMYTTDLGGRIYWAPPKKELLNGKTSKSNDCRPPTHCSTSGGVLGSPTSNVGRFIVLSKFLVASDDVWNQRQEEQKRTIRSYIPACFSPAKIASFAFKPYFFRSFSPFETCISSKGFPMQKSEYEGLDMIIFCERRDGWYYFSIPKKVPCQ